MEEEESLSQICTDALSQKARLSKLAVASLVFGVLAPLAAGAMWVVSFSNFITIGPLLIVGLFSCGLTWILGLALGVKSLEQIEDSQGQLLGREYAIGGVVTSVVWMTFVLAGFLLPALFYVNS